jgi:hypothetical protein
MSGPRGLVEHFFRYEFGRLVALLTRSVGVRWLALVESQKGTRTMTGRLLLYQLASHHVLNSFI